MEKELIKGILYSQFDEKAGPSARIWIPPVISEKIQDLISLKTINILAGEGGRIPESLGIIPFPSINHKGIVKYMEIKDPKRRGKGIDCSLTLLFDEADDIIFYKYIKNFEKIFDKTAKNIVKLEEKQVDKQADKHEILEELHKFQREVQHMLDELREGEVGAQEVAFPKSGGEEEEKHDFEWKLIVCGDPHVGKTSTILRFTDNAFRRTYIPTMGVNLSKKLIKYKDLYVKYVVWDIAGQSKFQAMRRPFYNGSDGVLLIFDLTDPKTLEDIRNWYEDITSYLEHEIDGFLLGNKNDLTKERKVERKAAEKMAKNFNFGYYETSAKTGESISEVFHKIAESIYTRKVK